MKIHLNNEPTDSYRIYLMDWECYAVRKTGDLFLQAMVPFPVSHQGTRKSAFSREEADSAYGNMAFPRKPSGELSMDRECILYFQGSGFSGMEGYQGIAKTEPLFYTVDDGGHEMMFWSSETINAVINFVKDH